MNESQFVWDHFKFNSEQRLKSFNFFVLLSIFADGGVFAVLERGTLDPELLTLLGGFIVVLAIIFWLVDTRSQNLLRLTIPALKHIESAFSEHSQLFRKDTEEQGRFVRYTFAFRVLQCGQLFFGSGVLCYGFFQWFDDAIGQTVSCL